MDGKLDTKAPPTPNVVYDGPEAKITLYVVNSALWATVTYRQNLKITRNLLRVIEIATELWEVLKDKGVQRLYCTADNKTEIKFNELLGFRLEGATIHDKHEIMVKEF